MIFENRQGTEVEKLVGEAWIDRIDALLQFVPFLLAQGGTRCDLFAQIDIVICPCTAFDRDYNRLGMGAGYYDRYLEKCVNAYLVAVAFDVQEAREVPVCEYDVKMKAVITTS